MGRADRERAIAEQERRLAEVERNLVEDRDRDELKHFRAMHTHERAKADERCRPTPPRWGDLDGFLRDVAVLVSFWRRSRHLHPRRAHSPQFQLRWHPPTTV